ncbi:MAG: efflux RND transporter periplasmic adaptor subunit [Alphaproteobacteria bacterium]
MSEPESRRDDHGAAPPAPHAGSRKKPSRKLLSAIGIIVVAAAAVAGYFYYSPATTSDAAPVAPPPPAVTVSAPLYHEITEWDEFTGQFAAVDYVELRARVSGYLTEIHFEDGQIVKQGDLLFVIDPRPYEATLASARAQLAEATAQVELAKRQEERSAQLLKKDFEARSRHDERVAELQVASASLGAAQAAVRAAELNLEFTRITAPVSGRISSHRVSVGNLVSGGESGSSTLLTTIVSLDPIYVEFDLSEADYLAYQRAAEQGRLRSTRDESVPVSLRLADEQDWPHLGRMDFVDNQVDRGSGTIRARAVFANPSLLFTPGQFGRLRIPGSEPYRAILVPDEAVVTDQSNKLVMVVKDGGIVEPRLVRPGPRYKNLRIIRAGLEPSDLIIIKGLMRARPGAKVTPQSGSIEIDPQAN